MQPFITIIFFIFFNNFLLAQEPHDDNLKGKNLICFNNSFSVDDWGIKFLVDKKVILYSLDKSLYEIYQYQRTYRTNLRNIIISKDQKIEYIINRSRLTLGNKKCKLVTVDPLILLKKKILDLKLKRKKENRI